MSTHTQAGVPPSSPLLPPGPLPAVAVGVLVLGVLVGVSPGASVRWPEGEVRILPSIKANLSQALRRILSEEGLGCDAFGGGELLAALRGGVAPEQISVNGPKDQAVIDHAVA